MAFSQNANNKKLFLISGLNSGALKAFPKISDDIYKEIRYIFQITHLFVYYIVAIGHEQFVFRVHSIRMLHIF